MLGVFAGKGYARVEPSILQPADVFLDRSGEEIRRRTFVFDDGQGNELCLRPDLTIPVCRMYLAGGAKTPARLCYHGPAFRAAAERARTPRAVPANRRREPGRRRPRRRRHRGADACGRGGARRGAERFPIKLGELGAVRGADRCARHSAAMARPAEAPFLAARIFPELLERLSQQRARARRRPISRISGSREPAEARAALSKPDGLFDRRAHAALGGRTREEIVERLMEQAAEAAAVRLDKSRRWR